MNKEVQRGAPAAAAQDVADVKRTSCIVLPKGTALYE